MRSATAERRFQAFFNDYRLIKKRPVTYVQLSFPWKSQYTWLTHEAVSTASAAVRATRARPKPHVQPPLLAPAVRNGVTPIAAIRARRDTWTDGGLAALVFVDAQQAHHFVYIRPR